MLQRKDQEFNIPYVEIPKDPADNRFVKSFLLEEQQEIKNFFDEYGFVVVRDIFTEKECKDSINDIWDYLEQKQFLSQRTPELLKQNPIDRSDPSTWGSSWPGMAEEGILGSPPVFTKHALLTRINPQLYSLVSFLLNRNDLLVNHDRYGLFRPTKNVDFGDGEIKDVSFWKTFYNVHLDANPWHRETSSKFLDNLSYRRPSDFISENNEIGDGLHIQGLINFAENVSEDGGFHIVPSFHKYEEEWMKSTRNSLGQRYNRLNTFIVLPESSCVQKLAQRVTMRAGSVIVWSQRVAHGSSPNNSSRARFAQFFKFFGASPIAEERMQARVEKLKEKVKDAGISEEELGELGMKLFGFKKWE